jgi:hypothetical protein
MPGACDLSAAATKVNTPTLRLRSEFTSSHAFRIPFTVDPGPSGVQQAVASGRSWLCPAFAFVPI